MTLEEIQKREQEINEEHSRLITEAKELDTKRRLLLRAEKLPKTFPPGFSFHYRDCGHAQFPCYWYLKFKYQDVENSWNFGDEGEAETLIKARELAWKQYYFAIAICKAAGEIK